jgi:hypothetical protein
LNWFKPIKLPAVPLLAGQGILAKPNKTVTLIQPIKPIQPIEPIELEAISKIEKWFEMELLLKVFSLPNQANNIEIETEFIE